MNNNRFGQAFREEANELLEDLKSALLRLEENPLEQEPVARVFRIMHTMKGTGAMFGFDDISSFTHNIESVYDLVRKGELPVTKGLINLSLVARDRIMAMLNARDSAGGVDAELNERVVASFKDLVSAVVDADSRAPADG